MSLQTLDTALPLLASYEALLPRVACAFDGPTTDPTPDAITLPQGGGLLILHLAPLKGRFDIGIDAVEGGRGGPGYGSGGRTTDVDSFQSVLILGALDLKKAGTLQGLARPYPYLYHALARAHQGLDGAVWRWKAHDYVAGRFDWGGVAYYALSFNNSFSYENNLPLGR